jgi:quercetin dioxygenase-like cupin family protein
MSFANLRAATLAICFALVAVVVFAFAGKPAATQDAQYQNLLTPILSGNQTIIDQAIAYPAGTPKVTAAIVVIPPGKDTGWHVHTVPLFVYVLEGEVAVDYGSKGVKVYQPGSGFLEAENWPHNGMNKTDKPVRIFAVYMGAEGVATASPANGPQ